MRKKSPARKNKVPRKSSGVTKFVSGCARVRFESRAHTQSRTLYFREGNTRSNFNRPAFQARGIIYTIASLFFLSLDLFSTVLFPPSIIERPSCVIILYEITVKKNIFHGFFFFWLSFYIYSTGILQSACLKKMYSSSGEPMDLEIGKKVYMLLSKTILDKTKMW